jgi:hypothetical protein
MLTHHASQSLAFDLIRAIDEPSPPEALEQSITVAHQRIQDYRELNMPDRIPDVLRNTLSIDIVEQRPEPETFVFSEDRERMAKDGTDKATAAHRRSQRAPGNEASPRSITSACWAVANDGARTVVVGCSNALWRRFGAPFRIKQRTFILLKLLYDFCLCYTAPRPREESAVASLPTSPWVASRHPPVR